MKIKSISIADEFKLEDLEAVADGLDVYEKTINVGGDSGFGDHLIESTTAYAARFIRSVIQNHKNQINGVCPECNGTGAGGMLECARCDGIGSV